jgi:hypothetical protein
MVLAGLDLGLSMSVPDHDAGVVGLSTLKYEGILISHHVVVVELSFLLNCH